MRIAVATVSGSATGAPHTSGAVPSPPLPHLQPRGGALARDGLRSMAREAVRTHFDEDDVDRPLRFLVP